MKKVQLFRVSSPNGEVFEVTEAELTQTCERIAAAHGRISGCVAFLRDIPDEPAPARTIANG